MESFRFRQTCRCPAAAAGFKQAADVDYTDLLKANGHEGTGFVTSGTPDAALLNTFDLVIISRSVLK